MNRISFIVSSKIEGQFLSPDTYVVLKPKIDRQGKEICGDDLTVRVKNFKWSPKTTLRRLAVSIYADQLCEEDKTGEKEIDERMLRESLSQEINRQINQQKDPNNAPQTSLSISQSPTNWIPLYLSRLPLTPKKNKHKKTKR
jgi:hypothetical protein